MASNKYYDGTKLLSLKDLNNEKPEIFICTSNRSAGKTTYFNKLAMNRFFKDNNRKFMLVYRFKYELGGCSDKFFKDIQQLFFPQYAMEDETRANGNYRELFVGYPNEDGKLDTETKKSCGYAIALNAADQLKKLSHLFSDTDCMIFDEFQSEINHYCGQEVEKLISIHTSVARGQGKQVRYVPVYMISNPVSLINPYYTSLGIGARLQAQTHFLRGNGWVLEQGFNESASNAQKESAFNKAFANSKYMAYNTEAVYLNDNTAFIEKPTTGKGTYKLTLRYKGNDYGVIEYTQEGIIYVSNKADTSYPTRIAVTTEDHQINYVMLDSYAGYIAVLRRLFERGIFRFKDLNCKEALMAAIGYYS